MHLKGLLPEMSIRQSPASRGGAFCSAGWMLA